jgi:cell division protein FtsB
MKTIAPPAQADATHGAPTLPQRRGRRPWIRRALVFFACVILLDSLFGDRGLAQTMRARRDYQRAVVELGRLRNQNATLRDEIRRLEADPAAIEAVARQELGLLRPGEILVLVKDAR